MNIRKAPFHIAVLPLSLLLSIGAQSPSHAVETMPSACVVRTVTPPVIDGRVGDSCWDAATMMTLGARSLDGTSVDFSIRLAADDENIYLLVSYPDPSESRRPASWIWDGERGIYVQTAGDEDGLAIFLVHPGNPNQGDLWIWRASRTDPEGYADDLSFAPLSLASSRNRMLDMTALQVSDDSGSPCWKSRYLGAYVGNNLPRFARSAQPSGSAADVRGKGVWNDGTWTIELSRRLHTGHADDISLRDVGTVTLAVVRLGDGAAAKVDTVPVFGSVVLP